MLPPPAADAVAAAVVPVFPASGAPAAGAAEAEAIAVSEAAADAVVAADALAAGALDAAGGGTEDAVGVAPVSVPSDFVHAITSAARERRTGSRELREPETGERMGGELTRKRI